MSRRTVLLIGGIAGALIGAVGILTYGALAVLDEINKADARDIARVIPWLD